MLIIDGLNIIINRLFHCYLQAVDIIHFQPLCLKLRKRLITTQPSHSIPTIKLDYRVD